MSFKTHGILEVTTPARLTYEGPKWSRISFDGVSIDPHNKLCQKHSYFFEMLVPTEFKNFVDQLIPGTHCAVHAGKIESPYNKSFTKIQINYKDFEILNITNDKEQKDG